MTKVKNKKNQTDSDGFDLSSAELEVSRFHQVIGWSVHCETSGRLGPLYTNNEGKLYYLDTITMQGYLPVSLDNKAYIDQ